jgi:hypothetical protein
MIVAVGAVYNPTKYWTLTTLTGMGDLQTAPTTDMIG